MAPKRMKKGPKVNVHFGIFEVFFSSFFVQKLRLSQNPAHCSPSWPSLVENSHILPQIFCRPPLQCLQSSRSHVGGSNLDFCVEEKFQMALNPWTGRSQLPPETFKFELRPVWCAAGTERHSPPPSPSWLERY